MIKIACLNYNNNFLANYNNHDIAVYYFNDLKEINKDDFFGAIIFDDRGNINIKKIIQTLKTKGFDHIYVITYGTLCNEIDDILDLDIKDIFTLPLQTNLISFKITKDYNNFVKKYRSDFIYKKLLIDLKAHLVFIEEKLVELTNMEYKLLVVLTKNIDRALSKEELLKEVWNYTTADYRSLETHIKTLRKKLIPYNNNIITIWGYGYLFSSRDL